MKKSHFKIIATLLIVLLIVSSFSGCGNQTDDGKINIVCTIFPQYDFVRELTNGCDNVEITLLLKAGQESHNYDPSSNDILAIHNADMFIYTGGQSDSWLDNVLASVDTEKMTILALTDIIEPVTEEVVEGMEHEDHEHDHEHEGLVIEYDEHVWTSVANAITISEAIADELCKIEGIDTDKVLENKASYIAELSTLNNQIKDTVSNAKRQTILVADRFPLRYFCDEYGITYYAAFPGCAASTEPSSSTLIFLTDKVRELSLPCIFTIELSAGNTAAYIAEETGAKVLEFHSCHNVSNDDLKAGKTYIDMMKQNLENLREALN